MKKGFTLIELLAVITILGIIALIATLSVNTIISDSKTKISEIQQKELEKAAELYHLEKGMNKNTTCVSINQLGNGGYLDSDSVKNINTGGTLTGSIQISYSNNKYHYNYQNKSCGCIVVNGSTTTRGSEIDCAGESFYVIDGDSNSVTMLAKYNLRRDTNNNIGNGQAYQFNKYTGYAYSEAIIAFSNNAYWVGENYSPAGTSEYKYVYDSNSILYEHIENYETYLENNDIANVSATLMSYEQALDLGCESFVCNNAPSWVYSSAYWLGTAYNDERVMAINPNHNRVAYFLYNNANGYGIRPVVTISQSNFN